MRSALMLLIPLLVGSPTAARRRHARPHPAPTKPAAAPAPMRVTVSPSEMTWSLDELRGGKYLPLVTGARPTATRSDGSSVAWRSIGRSADGHSITLMADDLKLLIVVQWLDAKRLPSAVTLLPVVYARSNGLTLKSVSLLGGARLAGARNASAVLLNGYQGWDASRVAPVTTGTDNLSWWVVAAKGSPHSFLAGYLSSVVGLNSFHAAFDASGSAALTDAEDLRRLSVPARADGAPLDALYLAFGASVNTLLKQYAAAAKVFTNVMDPAPAFQAWPAPSGWCSWYGYYGDIREDDVLANLTAAAAEFGPKALRVIQLDDGFQQAAGDWDVNAKFPHGHRWLTDRIHDRGYRAGLWIAPFAVSAGSTVYRDHPDWLLKGEDGTPAKMWTNAGWGGDVYSLDPSLPAVRSWLWTLFRKATREWGYDYLKIDFLYYPLSPNTLPRGPGTPVEAYRAALKAIRQGAGPKAYILGCGAPIGPTIGLVNGNRIGPDVSTGWPGIKAAARNVAARQWMHNVWWQNDPDALVVRPPLTEGQARAWTASAGLTAGLALATGNLADTPADRAALLHMAIPAAVRPGLRIDDLWTPSAGSDDPPSIWTVPNALPAAPLTVAAVFNWTDATAARDITPATLAGLAPSRRVHVWDAFSGDYLGIVSGRLSTPVEAASARLLAITPDTKRPQLLGTDINLGAGNGCVEGVSWTPKYRALKVRLKLPRVRPFRIAVSVPSGLTLDTLECSSADVERLPSAEGSAMVRISPKGSEILCISRYSKR
ncbi:MAG TPA: glycoside hydrolase family 36 protein [Armatimonadota bacterium]|jgi:alpha-galactosidase